MIAPQNAETSAIQDNYAKFRDSLSREKSGKFGKIRENSVKFGKVRENSGRTGEEPGKNRGRTGEEPGKSRGRTGEPKISPKTPKMIRGMGQNLPKMQFYRILMWKVVT